MLLQRMAALEEMLKLQKTQVYVLNIARAPPSKQCNFRFCTIFWDNSMDHRRSNTGHVHLEWQLRRIGMQHVKGISGISRPKDKLGTRYHRNDEILHNKEDWIQCVDFKLDSPDCYFLVYSIAFYFLADLGFTCSWYTSGVDVTLLFLFGNCFLHSEIRNLICNTEGNEGANETFTPTSHQVVQCI